ncbi:MAG TPA: hypothetical protein VFE19_11085 [Jatrophihabitantaceae bacterium]|nr:hypothetical protein [Jatrophihabitantaceae bacterium]
MSSLLELVFLAEFYVGTVIVPIMILAALVGNILLPLWGFRTVWRISGAVLPLVSWLIPMLALTMYNRPEGDLFVIGEFHQDTAFYGLLLIGAAAGFGTIVMISGRAARVSDPRPAARPSPNGREPARKVPPLNR